jgi:DNA-binding MarR family transcriptional regulator
VLASRNDGKEDAMSDLPEDTPHADDAMHDPLPRRNNRERHLETLSQEERTALARRGKTEAWLYQAEQEVKQLLRLKEEQENLYGTRARKEAAERLGVDPSTLYRMMKRYEENPSINALIPRKRGANPGQRLTEEQKLVICCLYLNPIAIQVGTRKIVPGRSTYTYIHQVVTAFYPPPVSEDTVYRFIQGLKQDHGVMVDMARRGERYVRDHIMPTPAFNVERPNQIWQLDARPLPIYVRHQGVITIPSLLLIIDHLSHYPIRARLIPRIERDTHGKLKRADVRNEDVGIVLASAIYELGIRPEKLYTDNGSCIIGVGDILANLLADGGLLTTFTRSIPGRPRGRGGVEQMLQAFDRLLINLPANMVPDPEDPNKKDHFTLMNSARQAAHMLELEGPEGLQGHIDTFINVLRNEPRRKNGKETRKHLWTGTGPLRAFPIRELMRLLPDERQVSRDAAIDAWKISFLQKEHGGDFEPRLDSDQDWDTWLLASSRPERIPLRAMKIDTGWKVEVCLDRDPPEPYWCELILKDLQMIDADYRNERINSSLKRVRAQYAELSGTLRDAAERIGLNTIVKQPGAGPVRLTDELAHPPAAVLAAMPPPPPPSVSVRTSNQEETPPPKPRKRIIDVDDLMREAEAEMEERHGTRPDQPDQP